MSSTDNLHFSQFHCLSFLFLISYMLAFQDAKIIGFWLHKLIAKLELYDLTF